MPSAVPFITLLRVAASAGLLLALAPHAAAQDPVQTMFEDPGIDFEAGDPFAAVPDPFAPTGEVPAAPAAEVGTPTAAPGGQGDAAAPPADEREMRAPKGPERAVPGAGVWTLGAVAAAAAFLRRRFATPR